MTVNLGLIGLGVVGSGTVALLQRNRREIERRAGCKLRIIRVAVRDRQKPRTVKLDPSLLTTEAEQVVADPNVHVVVEVAGGVEPARSLLLKAIGTGKSVVTCNKELLAKHGSELLDAARAASVDVNFEGAVGGGIPIIQPLKQQLVGNRIRRVIGIVNGTTNFILTKMTREGREFADVLAEAQALGYAEADPTADVDGYDAAYKLAILAAIAFGHRVDHRQVLREGIRGVAAADIEHARELGYTIKLLAIAAEDRAGFMELRVAPAFVRNEHPLAAVSDAFNAIFVEGDAVGPLMFFGRGAGAEATASAVVGDIVEIARNLKCGGTGRVPCLCDDDAKVKRFDDYEARWYLRMTVADKPGVIAAIATILGRQQVSIASVMQKGARRKLAEIVWITHTIKQAQMDASLKAIRKLPAVKQVNSVIRVAEDE